MAFANANISASDFSTPRTNVADFAKGGTAGENKLWLPLWSGEVIHAYDQYNMFESVLNTKSLTGGYSWDFPVTGTIGLNASWNAGVELGGYSGSKNFETTTFKVQLDKRPMATHFETDNIDLLVTQWDYRSELARQAGLTLANTRDKQLAASLMMAGAMEPLGINKTTSGGSIADPRFSSNIFPLAGLVSKVSSGNAGDSVKLCTEATALNILKEIEEYLVTMQENDLPTQNVYCVVTPKVFQVIRSLGVARTITGGVTTQTIQSNAFGNSPMFGSSSFYAGLGARLDVGLNGLTDTLEYMGVTIMKSNHIPNNVDYSVAGSEIGSKKYNLTFNKFDTFGIIFQSESVAGLSLQGMKVDTVQDVRRNTQFTVASMLKGTGIIKPETVKLLIGFNTNSAGASIIASSNPDAVERYRLNNALGGSHGNNAVFNGEYSVTSAYAGT